MTEEIHCTVEYVHCTEKKECLVQLDMYIWEEILCTNEVQMRMNRICTGQKYYSVQKNMYRKEVHRDNVQKRWNTEYKRI